MIVRLLRSGQRAQAFISPGTVQCALCQTFIRPNVFYTRHQAEVPATLWNRSPHLITYNLCYQHSPFRKETEEEEQRREIQLMNLQASTKKGIAKLKMLHPARKIQSGHAVSAS